MRFDLVTSNVQLDELDGAGNVTFPGRFFGWLSSCQQQNRNSDWLCDTKRRLKNEGFWDAKRLLIGVSTTSESGNGLQYAARGASFELSVACQAHS